VGRPGVPQCMFIPQRPYMPLGKLREQFLYGTPLERVDEAVLRRAIELTGLGGTVARIGDLDREEDWRSLLSVGEQELFGFARALLGRPDFLFLDEASNAVDAARREILYGELRRLGIRYISTGPRSSLDRFHNRVLELDGAGGWRVVALPPLAACPLPA